MEPWPYCEPPEYDHGDDITFWVPVVDQTPAQTTPSTYRGNFDGSPLQLTIDDCLSTP